MTLRKSTRPIWSKLSIGCSDDRCNRANRPQQSTRADAVRSNPDRCAGLRSEEHTSELQSLMRISYAVFCLKKKKQQKIITTKESGARTSNIKQIMNT